MLQVSIREDTVSWRTNIFFFELIFCQKKSYRYNFPRNTIFNFPSKVDLCLNSFAHFYDESFSNSDRERTDKLFIDNSFDNSPRYKWSLLHLTICLTNNRQNFLSVSCVTTNCYWREISLKFDKNVSALDEGIIRFALATSVSIERKLYILSSGCDKCFLAVAKVLKQG